MTDDQNSKPSPSDRRGGGVTLYILAAAVAAIAGFAAMSLAELTVPRNAVVVPPVQQAEPAAAAAGADAKPSGLERLVRVDPATPLTGVVFTDSEGRERRLDEWQGKVVLVNLWATWCAPCKLEMPSLDRLQAKLGGEKFAVLPISLDRTGPEKPAAFLTSNKLANLGLYLDSGNTLMQALRAPGLPLTVLVDAEGREFARLAGPAEWDSPEAEAVIRTAIAKIGGS